MGISDRFFYFISKDIESCRRPTNFLVHSLSCFFSSCTFLVCIKCLPFNMN